MKVGMDGRSLSSPSLRGWDRYTVGLIHELTQRDVEVVLLCPPLRRPRAEHLVGLQVRIEEVSATSGLLWEQWAVPRAVARLGCDLFHAPCEHGLPLVCAVPTILTVHSMTFHSYYEMVNAGTLEGPVSRYLGRDFSPDEWTVTNLYQGWQAKRATHIITPSHYSKEEVVHHWRVPDARVSVTHLGVPVDFIETLDARSARTTLERLGVRPPYLLYVSGFEPHKNVFGVLDVFDSIRRTRSDVQLVLVGSGAVPESLKVEIAGRKWVLGKDVVCFVDVRRELRAFYRGAACFISLSWRESFGLPAVEANVQGTPAVVSRYGASAEILGVGARLVDPTDVEAAAAVVREVVETGSRVPEVEIARLKERYSWARLGRATVDIYNGVLRGA